jgi:hypothetical protein
MAPNEYFSIKTQMHQIIRIMQIEMILAHCTRSQKEDGVVFFIMRQKYFWREFAKENIG